MQKRIKFIDISKGIGIILVVISHTSNPEFMYYTKSFFIPIFFFCSGYTSSLKELSFKENLFKHTKKLIKPYIFFNILLILIFRQFYLLGFIGIIYSRYCLYPMGTEDIIHFLINGNYPLWFFTCMIITYFLFYIIIYFPKFQYYTITIYFFLTVLLEQLPILLPWSLDTAFLMAIFMYSGHQFCLYKTIQHELRWLIILFSGIIYVICVPYCYDINISVRIYGYSISTCFIGGMAGCILLIYISFYLQRMFFSNLFSEIGKHSLIIFSLQIPFIILIGQPICKVLSQYFQNNNMFAIISVFIQTFIAITGGYLTSILLRKNKFLKRTIF